jgi:hypothetical protein
LPGMWAFSGLSGKGEKTILSWLQKIFTGGGNTLCI